MKKGFLIAAITFWVTGVSTYLLLLRKMVLAFLKEEQENTFLNWVIINFYPRFIVERHRFDPSFFIQKVDQIVCRLSLGFILIAFFWVVFANYRKVNYSKLYYENSQKSTVLILIRLYFGLMFYFASDWLWLLYRLSRFSEFYQGVFLFKLFHIPFLPFPVFVVLWSLLAVNIVFILSGYRIFINSILAVCSFIFLQGFLISFHKIDHTYTTFIYVGMWMPFLILEHKGAVKQVYNSQVLRMIQWTIIQVYLMAGLEKLLISGFAWIQPVNLVGHLKESGTPVGIWLAAYPEVCGILAVLALVFELGFGLVLIPKLRYWVLGMGILFHWGTFLLLGAGGWFSSWIAVYIFFIERKLLIVKS